MTTSEVESIPQWPYNSPLWGTIPEFSGRKLQADIIACVSITWLIALVFVILRFYTRGRLIHVLGPSDWCIIPSLIFSGGVTASAIEQAVRGSGTHFWQLELEQIPLISRASWYGILFYSLSLTFTKISILLLYRRIFTYSWAKRASQIVLLIVVVIGAWLVATVFTACVPLQAFWDWQVASQQAVYCHPIKLWWGNNGLHLATDVIIVLLPMPVLLKLRLPPRQKCALLGLFTLGFFVCIVSILRLFTLIRLESTPIRDPTYAGAELIYWTSVELNAATSCACIMTLKPLITRIFPQLLQHNSPSDCQRARLTPGGSPHSFGSRVSPDVLERGGGTQMAERRSRTKSGLLPWMEEGEAGLLEDVLEAGEQEARRSDSMSLARPDDEEMQQQNVGPSGNLRPPPKAHLRRLSIKVTKTVQVTTSPRSPAV